MAESNNNKYVQLAIPRFDGHYDHWMKLMENFFRYMAVVLKLRAQIYSHRL